MNLGQQLLRLWGFAAVAVVCSGQVQAAEVTGRVLDTDGQAVVGALVVAYDLRLAATVVETDSSGDFFLSQLLEQPHRLRVIAQEDNLVEQFWQAGGDFCASPPIGQGFETLRSK